MPNRSNISLALVVLAGVGASLLSQYRPRDATRLTLTPVVRAVLEDTGSPTAGATKEAADVTIVVFTDYQCPVCKATDPALKRLLERDTGIRVVYKDWPIFGQASKIAARAALAADRQGRYAAFHNGLMASRRPLDDRELRRVAASAGGDWDHLTMDLKLHGAEIDRQLARQANQAWSLGLQGTPAYLVGPYLVHGGMDDRRLSGAVRRARTAGPLR